ncbi:amidohydrolase [Thermoplasmatales archaeon AK]|nr:amidohydrolase [Thermoplasmatales archaeon AK]
MVTETVGAMNDPWEVALKVHELNEVGSQEYRSSKLLQETLRNNGFEVTDKYLGIPTAFRAEKTVGNGTPTIAFLAEYDALLGIGHACGHNLIASAAVFSAIRASKIVKNGKIVVLGTPDEEGTGEFSGSKILMVERGAFKDIDLVLGSHPGTEWNVGKNALAVQDIEVTYKGVGSHASGSPEKGRSALDAAILTYTAVNMLRQHVRRDANVVIHGVIREGGAASNVTPEKAVLVYGIRSSDLEYHKELMERFMKIVEGCCIATGTSYQTRLIGPLFSTRKINVPLANFVRNKLTEKGISVPSVEESMQKPAGGSTDFANVSQVVPAIELAFKIAPEGTPWHSHASMEAAVKEPAREALGMVIDVLSATALEFTRNPEFRKEIRNDFIRKGGKSA